MVEIKCPHCGQDMSVDQFILVIKEMQEKIEQLTRRSAIIDDRRVRRGRM